VTARSAGRAWSGHVDQGRCGLTLTRRHARKRHCQADRPILSPLIPGCSVAGDQDPSKFPVPGPTPRKCPECKLAAPRQRPSVPRPSEDGFWRRMAGRTARATRRAASVASGPPAARGEWRSPYRALWFGHAHLPMIVRTLESWNSWQGPLICFPLYAWPDVRDQSIRICVLPRPHTGSNMCQDYS
jgi:hypothetical protein